MDRRNWGIGAITIALVAPNATAEHKILFFIGRVRARGVGVLEVCTATPLPNTYVNTGVML